MAIVRRLAIAPPAAAVGRKSRSDRHGLDALLGGIALALQAVL